MKTYSNPNLRLQAWRSFDMPVASRAMPLLRSLAGGRGTGGYKHGAPLELNARSNAQGFRAWWKTGFGSVWQTAETAFYARYSSTASGNKGVNEMQAQQGNSDSFQPAITLRPNYSTIRGDFAFPPR